VSDVSYSVELGVNVPGQRLCVGEIGPFRTATQALIESAALIGKALPQVEERPDFCSFSETAIAQQHSAAITVPPGARIAGFTINRYHDDAGTDPNWFINGEGRAFETEARERDETVDGIGGFLEYGRCDTCGQPCNAGGCTVDPTHAAAKPLT
jgi:hypothetical protein